MNPVSPLYRWTPQSILCSLQKAIISEVKSIYESMKTLLAAYYVKTFGDFLYAYNIVSEAESACPGKPANL